MVNHHLFERKEYVWKIFHKNHHRFSFTTFFLIFFFGGSLFPGNFPAKKSKEMVTSKLERQERGTLPPLESSKKHSKNVGGWGGAV